MKIICVGRNYLSHIKELGRAIPTSPTIFMKPETALLKDSNVFEIPSFSKNVHYETEIVVRINRICKNISIEEASESYNEITIGLDFTARDIQQNQISKGLPWEISKAFDDSAVVGKFIPVSEIEDRNNLNFHLEINEKKVQQGNSSDLLFTYEKIISYVSDYFTLKENDLIFTGTPSGVGAIKSDDKLTGYLEERKVFEVLIK